MSVGGGKNQWLVARASGGKHTQLQALNNPRASLGLEARPGAPLFLRVYLVKLYYKKKKRRSKKERKTVRWV